MTFILRLPAILVLLVLVLVSLAGAFAATVVLAHLPVSLTAVLSQANVDQLSRFNWLQTGLLYGAGIFFLISTIRLMRRTT
jgi:membrane-bound acyltransferase YfiQ involved in biofilm formation